ncbi:MAG: ClpP family protease [Oscillospiraceae bacterium]
MNNYSVIKDTAKGIQSVSLGDELLSDRRIFLTEGVNPESMTTVIMQLMCLERIAPDEEITIYINSPGGEVRSGLMIYDYIRQMKTPVRTVCIGTAASMGAIIFLAGDKREMYPHTTLMIHDPSMFGSGNYEKPAELRERLDSLMDIRKILVGIIAERTGKSMNSVYKKTKKDSYFDAEEAVKFGLATCIIGEEKKED